MNAPAGVGPLDRGLDRAAGARLIPGNAVRHLIDGPQAYGAMLELIGTAHRWVHFENYIIRSDRTGQMFADHLIAAVKRGVRVRVLYDHFGSWRTRRSYWTALRNAGAAVRAHNPVNPLRPVRSLRRDHSKYVATDGVGAVVGGICIGDEWAGSQEQNRAPWRDTAALVTGPAVPALEYAFVRRWQAAGGRDTEKIPAEPEPCGDATVRVIDGVPGRGRLYRTIELLVTAAQERVWITDAYMLVPSPLYASLLAAARDGVDVRLLLPGKTDLPWIRDLTRVGYRELLDAGVRVWEWYEPVLHAKTVVVDDHWFKVGSSNLNPSSLFANHEMDVLVDQKEATAKAIHQFRRDLGKAVEIVRRPRRVPEKLAARLPPAIVRSQPAAPMSLPPATARELSRRAAVTLRHVAGGARRSITGAVFFVSLGLGALFVLLPRIMAYAVAAAAFWLSVSAAWQYFQRRRYHDE
jgi:cardiolipin synthase